MRMRRGEGRGLLIDGHWETEHDVSVILGGGGTYHGSLKFCTSIELVFPHDFLFLFIMKESLKR